MKGREILIAIQSLRNHSERRGIGTGEDKSVSLHLTEYTMFVNIKRHNGLQKECATKEGSECLASRWRPSDFLNL